MSRIGMCVVVGGLLVASAVLVVGSLPAQVSVPNRFDQDRPAASEEAPRERKIGRYDPASSPTKQPDPTDFPPEYVEAMASLSKNPCQDAVRPENDLCEDARPITGPFPAAVEGTTCGATSDVPAPGCAADTPVESTGPGVWYSVMGTGNTMIASTCQVRAGGATADFDTKISVYCAPCADDPMDLVCVTANNDDSGVGNNACDTPPVGNGRSSAIWCSEVGSEYLILVHGDEGVLDPIGDFTLIVTDNNIPCDEESPCEGDGMMLECPQDAIIEDEPVCFDGYIDNTNGGCESDPPAFQTINCGDTICGTSGVYSETGDPNSNSTENYVRDMDFFRHEVTEAMSVTWRVIAEFPVRYTIFREVAAPGEGCELELITSGAVGAFTQASSTGVRDPGVYYYAIYPNTFEPSVPCGSMWIGELLCNEAPNGACCLDDGTCLDGVSSGGCASMGGEYQGDGSVCAGDDVPCVLQLSECSSDDTPAEDISADLEFFVDGSTLTVAVTNLSVYRLNQFYFNGDDVVTLDMDPVPGWELLTDQGVDGFGTFDFCVNDGVGSMSGVAPGETEMFSFTISGGPASVMTFTSNFSTIPPGSMPKLGAAKFVAGPGDDSAFGATASNVPDVVECEAGPPPNDECADAITVDVPSMTMGTTIGATEDNDFPGCEVAVTSPGVWYSVIGTGSVMSADVCDAADFDSKISIYCGDCEVPVCVAGDDDGCSVMDSGIDDLRSYVEWCSQAGAEYLILVHGFGGDSGNFVLNVMSHGGTCEPEVNCLTTGACCFDDGSCQELTEAECLAAGGQFQGEGVLCCREPGIYECMDGQKDSFMDISGTGTELMLADDDGEVVPLGFTFEFFGDTHVEVGVSSNGYLTFGSDLSDFSNDVIPSPNVPNDLIAPLWDDFNPEDGGSVHYETIGSAPDRVFIAQWTDVPQFDLTDSNTFQVALFEGSNRIEFRYGAFTPQAFIGDYTVGVENQDGTDGLSVDASTIEESDCLVVSFVEVPSPCPDITPPVVECEVIEIPHEQCDEAYQAMHDSFGDEFDIPEPIMYELKVSATDASCDPEITIQAELDFECGTVPIENCDRVIVFCWPQDHPCPQCFSFELAGTLVVSTTSAMLNVTATDAAGNMATTMCMVCGMGGPGDQPEDVPAGERVPLQERLGGAGVESSAR